MNRERLRRQVCSFIFTVSGDEVDCVGEQIPGIDLKRHAGAMREPSPNRAQRLRQTKQLVCFCVGGKAGRCAWVA